MFGAYAIKICEGCLEIYGGYMEMCYGCMVKTGDSYLK